MRITIIAAVALALVTCSCGRDYSDSHVVVDVKEI